MATIGNITVKLTVDPASMSAMIRSLTSLEACLSQRGVDAGEFTVELGSIDARDFVTVRTDELTLSLEPTDRYSRLVAAMAAREVDGRVLDVEACHGWPILSVGGRTSTVAPARGESL